MKLKGMFNMKKKILRIGLLSVILTIGGIAAAKIPQAVESFLPQIETLSPTKISYCPTVSAAGAIILDETGNWYACVSVGEGDINSVELGQSAGLSGAALDSGYYTATVTSIADTAHIKADGASVRTVVDVTLKLDNPDERLRSGYTVQADIKTAEERVICLLPYSTIGQDEVGEYVYVLDNNTAVRRSIVTGAELSDGAEIVSGVGFSESVVVNPSEIKNNEIVKTW